MDILKIAVTGSAGSGKSLVCRWFQENGFHTLDCDVIARQVVEPGKKGFEKVVQLFGQQVVSEDGSLDRSVLRGIIVNNDDMRKQMEEILHPQILAEMIFQMEHFDYTDKKKVVAVEVPLLFETGMEKYFDANIAVIADQSDLVSRIANRDTVTKKDAKKMLDLQMPQEQKIARANHVIKNRGSISELFESVSNIFNTIQKEFLIT